MNIGEIIGEYVYLKPLGDDFVGRCPFCLSNRHIMVVIPKLGIYECLHCGRTGGAVDFVKAIECIINWEYRRSLKRSAPHHITGTVYVLSLKGGRYYVGFTENLQRRLNQHFAHQGSLWTKRFQALKLIDVYYDVPEFVEHRVTRCYIERYGADNVRGGFYVDARELSEGCETHHSRNLYLHKAKFSIPGQPDPNLGIQSSNRIERTNLK